MERTPTETLESWFKLTFRLIVGEHWQKVAPLIVDGDTTYRWCREMILNSIRNLEDSTDKFLSAAIANIKDEIWKLRSINVEKVQRPIMGLMGGPSVWENTFAMTFDFVQNLPNVADKLTSLKLAIVSGAFAVRDKNDALSLKAKLFPVFLTLKDASGGQSTTHEDVIQAFYIFAEYLEEQGISADEDWRERMGKQPINRSSSWQPPESWCFGDFGDKEGQFEYPIDVLVNKQNEFLVLEENSKGKNTIQRLQLFNNKGRYLKTILQRGRGGVTAMSDMTLDKEGNVVVSLKDENGVGRVNVYNMQGDCVQAVDVLVPNPEFPPFFQCVAVDRDERILVVEHHEMAVQVYGNDGKFLFKFGKGEHNPTHGTFDNIYSLNCSQKNEIYICDPYHCVQVFDNKGRYLRSFKPAGIVPSSLIVIEDENLVYGVNREGHAVEVYSLDGTKVLKKVGGFGNELGRFWCPMGIAMTPDGKIAVAEKESHRIQVVKM